MDCAASDAVNAGENQWPMSSDTSLETENWLENFKKNPITGEQVVCGSAAQNLLAACVPCAACVLPAAHMCAVGRHRLDSPVWSALDWSSCCVSVQVPTGADADSLQLVASNRVEELAQQALSETKGKGLKRKSSVKKSKEAFGTFGPFSAFKKAHEYDKKPAEWEKVLAYRQNQKTGKPLLKVPKSYEAGVSDETSLLPPVLLPRSVICPSSCVTTSIRVVGPAVASLRARVEVLPGHLVDTNAATCLLVPGASALLVEFQAQHPDVQVSGQQDAFLAALFKIEEGAAMNKEVKAELKKKRCIVAMRMFATMLGSFLYSQEKTVSAWFDVALEATMDRAKLEETSAQSIVPAREEDPLVHAPQHVRNIINGYYPAHWEEVELVSLALATAAAHNVLCHRVRPVCLLEHRAPGSCVMCPCCVTTDVWLSCVWFCGHSPCLGCLS